MGRAAELSCGHECDEAGVANTVHDLRAAAQPRHTRRAASALALAAMEARDGAVQGGVQDDSKTRRPTPQSAGAPPQRPGKKLVIKPFKAKPKLPEDFAAATWERLSRAVCAVMDNVKVEASYEELYGDVENMCLHKLGAELYSKLHTLCGTHVADLVRDLAQEPHTDPLLSLQKVHALWAAHCDQLAKIRSVFLYLDRTYVLQTQGLHSIWEMGLALFRDHLGRSAQTERKAVSDLLALVERERSGETVDRSLLKNLIRMFTALGTYASAFERPFLVETAIFYEAEGARVLQQTDVPGYLRHCESRLTQELERCVHYLDPGTRKALISTVEERLLERHSGALLEKGFDALMDRHCTEDLARMYTLYGRVGALDLLRQALSQYIRRTGAHVVKDEEKDKEMVELLLDMKKRVDEVHEVSFARSEAFANTLKDSFEQFINSRPNRPAELVAKFIDGKLRAGNKGQTDEELEHLLDRVLILFRFIQGKDVFEAFYKKDLAKRLLLGKSASIDAEKSMISKLKAECGSQFTTKLEGMFKDINLSKDIMGSFRQATRDRLPQGLEMYVNVLTAGYWPTYAPMEVNLPKEISDYQDVFKDFYLEKHSGRRLMWLNTLGQCVLKATFKIGRVHELSVSLLQAVVLMLFNDCEELSFEDIKAATAMEDKELRRQLQSLACGKVRALVKRPASRDVNDGDCFVVNRDFDEKRIRVQINTIQLKETAEENQQTNERVHQDRQYQLDAAIVRIMKTRKTLSHSLLIKELLTQVKFPAKSTDMKKRIESLIEREYLERDRSNASIYNYLA